MPTAFTHALVGGAFAAGLPQAQRTRRMVLALAAVAVLPDADVAGFWVGIPYEHPLGHRGLSHSLPFAVALGMALAVLLHRGETTRTRVALGAAYAAAAASHGVLDAFTDGGLGIGFWIPFSDERLFAPVRPILTSSLNPAHAFGPRGLRVLTNEALWIGLPTVAVLGVVAGARALAARGE